MKEGMLDEDRPSPQEFLPLNDSTRWILLSFANGPRHGYSVLKDVTAMSNGSFYLALGNLYTYIDRLEKQELLEYTPNQSNDRRRNVFGITPLGIEVLKAEYERLSRLREVMGRVLGNIDASTVATNTPGNIASKAITPQTSEKD